MNFVAAVITIIGVPLSLINRAETAIGVTLALSVSVLLCLAWTLLIVEEFRYSRKARFAEAVGFIHQAIHELRDAWFSIQERDSADTVYKQIAASAKSISSAFSLITGVKCWVVIMDRYRWFHNLTQPRRGDRS
ncbi:hypothetical protein JXA47_17225 [Candidatus Sumerlaeota bacterium]|nr:hypothetical protein [Candidatus Sumerlaeota bacterium]